MATLISLKSLPNPLRTLRIIPFSLRGYPMRARSSVMILMVYMYSAMDWEPFVVFIKILRKLSILVRDWFAKVVSSFCHASWEVVAEEISGATAHVTDARMAWRMRRSCRFHNLHSGLEIGVVEPDCRMVSGGQGVVPSRKPNRSYLNRILVNWALQDA